jgi:hypothetical protein
MAATAVNSPCVGGDVIVGRNRQVDVLQVGGGNLDRLSAAVLGSRNGVGTCACAEESHSVELLGFHRRELVAEDIELELVERAVVRGLGDIERQGREFRHAVEDFVGVFHDSVLGLQVGDRVADIGCGGVGAADGRAHLHRDGETAGVVGRGDNAIAAGKAIEAFLEVRVGGAEVVGGCGGSRVGVDNY